MLRGIKVVALFVGLIFLGITSSAEGALLSRLGGQAVYDTHLDITWWADADVNGLKDWNTALNWAANATFGGYTDWRLPTTMDPDPTCSGPLSAGGYGCTGSEMGHLFYNELGGTAHSSILNSTDPDLSKFTNLRSYRYWSGTPATSFASTHAWTFWTEDGNQDPTNKNEDRYAMAVRQGDVGAMEGDYDPQPRQDPPPVPSSNNLVLYTHGWNTSQSDWDNGDWNTLRSALNAAVDDNEWAVEGHDWSELSGNAQTGPQYALNNAATQGQSVGWAVAEESYDHVHLIAHSAGAHLISHAAKVINDRSPSTEIHMTFLDPYAPNNTLEGFYGFYSDWAENYSAFDATDAVFINPSSTYAKLPWAHNVDVSAFGNTHSGPVEFYTNTIIDSINGTNNPDWGVYGFQRSLEAGGWSASNPSNYPLGDDWVVLGGGSAGNPNGGNFRLDSTQNVESVPHTTSSGVQVTGPQIEIPTFSPGWISMLLDITDPVNFVSFDAEFLSEIGAEGLLAMYWDGEAVSTIDERFALSENNSYTMWLTGVTEPGIHELAFRLDPFTGVQSRVLLDNIQTGFAGVPEPSSVMLLAMCGLVFVYRIRNWA